MLGLSKDRERNARWQRAAELLLAEAHVAAFSKAVELALVVEAKLVLTKSLVSGKALSVPTHNRLRPHDGYSVKDARAATVEKNEQSTIDPTQMRPAWRSPL